MSLSKEQDHWELIYSNQSHADLSWYQSVPKISLELINQIKLRFTMFLSQRMRKHAYKLWVPV